MFLVCSETKSKVAVAVAIYWAVPVPEGSTTEKHRSSVVEAARDLSPAYAPEAALPTVSVALAGILRPSQTSVSSLRAVVVPTVV